MTAKTTGCILKSDAKNYCEKLYLEGTLGNSNINFGRYARKFFDQESIYLLDRPTPLAENTVRLYRICFNTHILPYFEDFNIADIKYTTLRVFRTSLIEKKLSTSSINTIMRTLSLIFKYATRDGIISKNPYDFLDSYNAKKNQRDAFTLEELKQLIITMPKEFKNFVAFLALTGMRISEAIGITEDDIKHDKDFLYIDLKKQFNNHKYKPLKTKECRCIPIIPEVAALYGFKPIRLPWFYKLITTRRVFFKDHEERMLSTHSLRHFFITQAKVFGINPMFVEVLAGHKLNGMEGVYTNFKVEDLVSIMDWQKAVYDSIKEYLQPDETDYSDIPF